MKRLIMLILMIYMLATNVYATEFTAPVAPEEAQQYMPSEIRSFGSDLWFIIKQALSNIFPTVKSATVICISVISVILITVFVRNQTSISGRTVELVGTISVSAILLSSSNSMIRLSVNTIENLRQYGKLLLPVMTSTLAAEGGVTTSTALYIGTIIFDNILVQAISTLIVPMLYAFLAISIALSGVDNPLLKNCKDFFKWLVTWILKLGIYIFTGYMGITKVISGTTDAAMLKAAKITISGTVPIVGGIISDASEAILVSAKLMKNAAGTYGILALISICVVPFLTIGVQYFLLKITGGICQLFHNGKPALLINDFIFALGTLLATTGTVCIIFLISVVCFMKGVS